ncbi:MAG TPA: hypothetical protein VFI11_13500 [Anaerolineales bacterium]|nr:hypothetical protein [Anaerolineales bacterium]
MRRWITPAFVLLFLSPAVGELLSTSSPPVEFFQPFTLPFMAALYGCGALLVRELAFRWRQGWPAILLLGAAYGIVEEGLAVKSFFDPNWVDLGILGVYGRWLGVNWVWSVGLAIYHAVFSIGIPILLVGLLFPAERDRPWLSAAGFRWAAAIFGATTIFMNLALTAYRPTALAHILSAASVVALGAWAQRVRPPTPAAPPPALASPLRVGLSAFGATLGLFFFEWFLPNTSMPALVWVVLVLGYVAWLWMRFGRRAAHPDWSPGHSLAMAAGALAFFVLASGLAEIDPNRVDNTTGTALVGLAAVGFLIWMGRRVRSGQNPQPGLPGKPGWGVPA